MEYLRTPFIPQNQVTLAMVDYRIENETESFLLNMGIELIKTVPCHELYEAINGHPDILMHPLGDERIILAPNIFDRMAPEFAKKGFAVTKGVTWLARNYPGNIAYNVLRIGKLAFHNTKHTDPEILKALEENRTQLIHINQGYSKCSVCVLDEYHIITSDYKIAETVKAHGIDCLLIKSGGIGLIGMNYGFIGGASGLLAEKCIAFTGNIGQHEDGEKILEYINNCGFTYIALNSGGMTDIGSIIPLLHV